MDSSGQEVGGARVGALLPGSTAPLQWLKALECLRIVGNLSLIVVLGGSFAVVWFSGDERGVLQQLLAMLPLIRLFGALHSSWNRSFKGPRMPQVCPRGSWERLAA